MTIEKLSALDVESILQLESDFLDGWSKGQLISAFDSGRFSVLGAKENNQLIGFVSFSITIDSADVETVFVKIEHRRKGIAQNLIDSAIKTLSDLNVKKIFLEVRQSNYPARSLYQKLGFSDISVRKSYYPDGENAVVMAKELL